MLSKLTRLGKLIIYTLTVTSLIGAYLIPKSNLAHATDCFSFEPPELIITNPIEGQTVSGSVPVRIDGDEGADWVHIEVFYELGEQQFIYDGPERTSYPWDTTQGPDGDHELKAWASFPTFPFSKESKCHDVTVDNSASGNGSPPPSGQPPPTTGDDGGSQTTSNQPSSQTSASEDDTDKAQDNGSVEEVIIEQEVPITIDSFDPDLFLKGGDVKIKEVKNLKEGEETFLRFSGTAKPDTLVTLYVFSTAVVVVVKSDEVGDWVYDREKDLTTGKHTVFATIYGDGVTRRSNVVEFFIAKDVLEDRSLILSRNNLQRFYPYAAVLGGAIVFALLILTLYRIYSRRRVAVA